MSISTKKLKKKRKPFTHCSEPITFGGKGDLPAPCPTPRERTNANQDGVAFFLGDQCQVNNSGPTLNVFGISATGKAVNTFWFNKNDDICIAWFGINLLTEF